MRELLPNNASVGLFRYGAMVGSEHEAQNMKDAGS